MSDSILSSISSIPKERVAIISQSKIIHYGDLKKIYDENKEIISTLRGSNITIDAKSKEDFAILLCILDGIASNILFLPEDIEKNVLDKYYNDANINDEVSLIDSKLLITPFKEREQDNIKTHITTNWIIPTSGTTKAPKLVSHTFKSLTKSTIYDIEIGKNYIWGFVFDIKRFSGIQVFLQSLLGGSTILFPEENTTTSTMLKFFVKHKCNIISATPSFFRKLLMSKEADLLNLKRVTLGGEIVDMQILSAIKNKFANTKITHIYASTEAGVGFSVNDERAGFNMNYLNDNVLEGVVLSIRNNILFIKPNIKSQSYLSHETMFEEDGFINTGDLVEIRGDRVYFLGRESGAINVGGNKVQPEEIEEQLLSTGLVHSAYVYAKKSPIMGSLICADIIPLDDTIDQKLLKTNVLDYVKNHLESFKVPAIIKIVNELSITQSGKIKRS